MVAQHPISLDEGARALEHARTLANRASDARLAWGALMSRVRTSRCVRTHAFARGPRVELAIDLLLELDVCASCLAARTGLTGLQITEVLRQVAKLDATAMRGVCKECGTEAVVHRLGGAERFYAPFRGMNTDRTPK